jgi:ankyrin repeat protein
VDALRDAAAAGSLEIVKLILDKRPDIATEGVSGKRALREAAEKGHLEIVKPLQARGVQMDPESRCCCSSV